MLELQTLSAYLTFLTELGVLLDADRNLTEQSMLKVIDLEQHIAEVRTTPALTLSVCFVVVRSVECHKP